MTETEINEYIVILLKKNGSMSKEKLLILSMKST